MSLYDLAEQVAAYFLSALAGGTMFYRWRRISEEDRGRVWKLYGWFSGLMMCGSFFGALAWLARMMSLVTTFRARKEPGLQSAERLLFESRALSLRAAFDVTYAIELIFLCAAKLMVLDRMHVFLSSEGIGARKWWAQAGRIVMVVVVLGNSVGLAANSASAFHYQKAAEATRTAYEHLAAGDSSQGNEYRLQGIKEVQYAGSIGSVQSFCEVVVLLFIVTAFTIVGFLSARHFSFRLLSMDTSSHAAVSGRALRLQVACTTSVVFFAFLLRSVTSTLEAVAFQMRAAEKGCATGSSDCDALCWNAFTHIVLWINYTPEFQSMIVLVSSPLALTVALWGMTSKIMLQIFKHSSQRNKLAEKILSP
jgi:hypothetical protein